MDISFPEPLKAMLRSLEPGAITTLYGAPGSGKTNLCLLAALACAQAGGRAVYIDSEGGFSKERAAQLCQAAGLSLERFLAAVELVEPGTLRAQGESIRSLAAARADLIIIDSAVALYRAEYAEVLGKKSSPASPETLAKLDASKSPPKEARAKTREERRADLEPILDANRELSRQLSSLSQLCRERKIPVLITAHAYRDFDTGDEHPIGGDALRYWSKALVFLERTGRLSERKATLMKHRSLPEGGSVRFQLVDEGIKPASFRLF